MFYIKTSDQIRMFSGVLPTEEVINEELKKFKSLVNSFYWVRANEGFDSFDKNKYNEAYNEVHNSICRLRRYGYAAIRDGRKDLAIMIQDKVVGKLNEYADYIEMFIA